MMQKLNIISVRPLGTSFRYPVSDMMTSHNDEYNRDTKHNQNYNHNLLYRGPKTVSVKRRAKSSGKHQCDRFQRSLKLGFDSETGNCLFKPSVIKTCPLGVI